MPVIASNRINTVALAEELLAAGDADFVSMARPLLADPEIVREGALGPRGERVHRLQSGVHRPLDLRPAGVVCGQPSRRL